jgi:hypothetical protein
MTPNHEIQETYIQRPQSPEVEHIMGKSIHDVLKILLAEGYLYQNRSVDLTGVLAKADSNFSTDALADEFTHRPWIPYSQNRGFTTFERDFTRQTPSDPLEAPLGEMRLMFLIPTIETWCGLCKDKELHDSIPHLAMSPYHINPEAIKEPLGYQTVLFNFQCQKCKSPPITFMVRRELLKIQLCGRSKPYFPAVLGEIPKSLRAIYCDAAAAAACGDLSAGFYHLRTLLEHHMKAVCGIATQQQVDGADLCQRYNKTLDPIVAERVSLSKLFSDCSANLHNRTGGQDEFKTALNLIEGHFKLIENLKALSA